MTDNPYRTPQAQLGVDSALPPRPILGVFAGLFADIGGTFLAFAFIAGIYAFRLASGGATAEQIGEAIAATETLTPYGVSLNLVGLLMSFLGGYVCIAVSRGRTIRNAVILAVITLVLAVLATWGEVDLGVEIVLVVIAFAATLLGGRTALSRRAR